MKKTNYLSLFFKGIAMGAADVVPGVSGGTIAFISGIYEELLAAIASINLGLIAVFKKAGIKGVWKVINGKFLFTLLSGIFISIISLSKVITWLLATHPILVWSFFFGLIIASILLIVKQISNITSSKIIALVLGTIFAYYIANLPLNTTEMSSFYLFLSGAIAVCAMILPGISGAFILVLMGSYSHILEAIHKLDIKTIALVGIGAAVGLLSFSRLLNWTFKKYTDLTLAVLSGFLIGSLTKVWPWKKTLEEVTINNKTFAVSQQNILPRNFDGNSQVYLALLLALLGFLVIYLLEKWGSKNTTDAN